MKEDLQAIVQSMKESKHSFISKDVSAEDVEKVLQEIGNFIRDHQQRGYAVYVKEIGLFTLFQQKLLISHHPIKYSISQKPVFQLSHSLAAKFRVKWARQIAESKLPQKLFNPSAVALKCDVDRAKVIFCLRELGIFIERNLSENKRVRVPIYGVGTLKIDEDEWLMDFDQDYLKTISMRDVLHVVEDM